MTQVRSHRLAGSRFRRLCLLVAASLTSLVLAGCASTAPATTSSPTPTPSAATSTPTPTADAGLQAPNQVFGADCEAALTSAQISDVLGETVTTEDTTPNASVEFAVAQAGGVSCNWAGDGEDGTRLISTILPAALLPPEIELTPFCEGTEEGVGGRGNCNFELVSSGMWLSGILVTGPGTVNNDARAAITALSDHFAANASAAAEFNVSAAAPGTWPPMAQTDCGTLAASAPVTTALAGSSITGVLEGWGGGVSGLFVAGDAAQLSTCVWTGTTADGQYVDVGTYILPGAAWAQASVAQRPGAEEVDVAGLERVISVPGELSAELHVFDGDNWLQISAVGDSTRSLDTLGPLAVAWVTALNDAR